MAYIGKIPTIGNFQVCDAISVVNNQAAYTMQVGGVNVSPESSQHMLVSLNGVIQKNGGTNPSFTVSGSTITFASNLVTGDVIDFIQILGNVLDLGVPSDATVSTAKIVDGAVTSAKMFSGFANGITEADQWRLTADLSNNGNLEITANLERVDDATFSKMGTGMSESSGVFTFPSTGLYFISMVTLIYVISGDGSAGVDMKISSDSGSNYDLVAHSDGGNGNSAATYLTVTAETFVNVTNASTFRVKFFTNSMTNSQLRGNTNSNDTSFTFIRLGDSQ